jgi:competence protein ComEC
VRSAHLRLAVELQWPSLLAAATCLGLAAANVASVGLAPGLVLASACLLGVALLDEWKRVVALGLSLAALGLTWGSLRVDALERSALEGRVGESGQVEVITTQAARTSPWAVRVVGATRAFDGVPLRERVLLVLPASRSPPRGAILDVTATVTEPREASEPGGFDERTWLSRQGIHVVLKATGWRQVGSRGGVTGVGDEIRDRIARAVTSGTGGVRRGIVLGVVLGEDEGLPRRTRDDFRASGLTHLLAVSGQNVAFIVVGIHALGWLLKLSRMLTELAVLAAIAGYVLAVGWQPSVVRAGIAGALVSMAWLAARGSDRWHFLALGALVLLAWTPTTLLEPGFQLSFAAVAAIFVAVPRLRRACEGYPIPRGLAEALAVALACGLVTAPIVLYHFDQAPVYTVPANVLAFPAVPAVLGLGLLSGAAGLVSPAAAAALAWLAGWAAAWLELVSRVVANLPGAQVGARGAVLLAAGAGLGWLAARHLIRRLGRRTPAVSAVATGAALVCLVGWWALRPSPAWTQPGGLRVTFLDVGQGDSVLLETPSARVLVDQGPPEADVAGQLLRMGVRSLSALVLTHPQRDHVGGAADVLRDLRVGAVLEPGLKATGPEREEAVAAARERGVPVRVVREGDEFRVGGLVLRVLWPEDAGAPSEDPNQNAVVLLASFGETDVLLPADAESDVTARIPVGVVEVFKVAHHGSEDTGLDDQLRALRPRVAVISCGRDNDYGHPRPETLAALAARPGLAVFRTDVDGRVVVESDGRRLRVLTGQ